MIIDVHTHAFPDTIARRAIETLSAKGEWSAKGDGTVSGLLAAMDAAGVDKALVCAVATKPAQVEGILRWLQPIAEEHADRLWCAASLHPGDDDAPGWVRRIGQAGLTAVKLHPQYQDFRIDDEAMLPIYQAAIDANLLVTMHCGLDIGFPNDPTPDRAAPHRIASLMTHLPRLRMLCTHMGGWKQWDQVRQHLLGRDVFFDTSFCLTHMAPDAFVSLVRDHGLQRVCFGTDWPWNDPTRDLEQLARTGLGEDELTVICETTPLAMLAAASR